MSDRLIWSESHSSGRFVNLDNRSITVLNDVNNFDLIDVDQANMNYAGMSSPEIVIAQKFGKLVEIGQFALELKSLCRIVAQIIDIYVIIWRWTLHSNVFTTLYGSNL